METLQQQKQEALKIYKEKKIMYIKNMTNDNWVAFCEAKRKCMMLGIII